MEQELRFPTSLTIQGRPFALCLNTTVNQDTALENAVTAAGLRDIAPLKDEDEASFTHRIFRALLDSGVWAELLACRLASPGKVWSAAEATEIKSLLETMSDPEEKRTAMELIPYMVLGFFANGLASFATSRMSSGEAEPMDQDDLLRGVQTLQTTLGHGAGSFGRWLTRIRFASRLFWTALFARSSPVSETGSGSIFSSSSDTTASNT